VAQSIAKQAPFVLENKPALRQILGKIEYAVTKCGGILSDAQCEKSTSLPLYVSTEVVRGRYRHGRLSWVKVDRGHVELESREEPLCVNTHSAWNRDGSQKQWELHR
jgi:hypothetical protein